MNRKQWVCSVVGFLLLVLSLLFVPTHPYRSPLVSYSFLFIGQGPIDFGRLFVEWVLVVLVIGALFLALSKSKNSAPEKRNESSATSPKKGRVLLLLTATLAALALCLSILSYAKVKKVRRLEAGIQNVDQMVDAVLNDLHERNMRELSLYSNSQLDFVQDATQGRIWSPHDMSQIDSLKHPTLGELWFPHTMPPEARNQMIERVEQAQQPLRQIKKELDKLE